MPLCQNLAGPSRKNSTGDLQALVLDAGEQVLEVFLLQVLRVPEEEPQVAAVDLVEPDTPRDLLRGGLLLLR